MFLASLQTWDQRWPLPTHVCCTQGEAGRGTHKAQAHLHGLMVLSLFHKIIALSFFFAALLGGGRSPLTHFSDYASLMSLFSQTQRANAVFVLSCVDFFCQRASESVCHATRQKRRCMVFVCAVCASVLLHYSACDEKLSRSAVLLESSIFCYCREIKHGCQLAFPMRSITFWAEGVRKVKMHAGARRHVLKHTNQYTETNNHPNYNSDSINKVLSHIWGLTFVWYHSLTLDSPDTLCLKTVYQRVRKKTVSLILLVFRFFPLQLLMLFKKHSYEQIKLSVPLEIQ